MRQVRAFQAVASSYKSSLRGDALDRAAASLELLRGQAEATLAADRDARHTDLLERRRRLDRDLRERAHGSPPAPALPRSVERSLGRDLHDRGAPVGAREVDQSKVAG